MSFFNVRFKKLVRDNIPKEFRKPKILIFMDFAISEVKILYEKFKSDWRKLNYKIDHGQHITQLEAVLNDEFDMAFRRIRVENAPVVFFPAYTYLKEENKPIALFTAFENNPVSLSTNDEIDFAGIDFKILIPVTIPFDQTQMIAIVEKLKVPGTVYIIEQIL